MIETMYQSNGVGLAAPQVGILKRIAVVDIGQGVVKLINPEIIYFEGSQIDIEGALVYQMLEIMLKGLKKLKLNLQMKKEKKR